MVVRPVEVRVLGDQLVEFDRLGEVVQGPGLQAPDGGRRGGVGAQNGHRRQRAGLAQGALDGERIRRAKVEINNDRIPGRGSGQHICKVLLRVRDQLDLEPRRQQAPPQHACDRFVRLDEQDRRPRPIRDLVEPRQLCGRSLPHVPARREFKADARIVGDVRNQERPVPSR
jgi:hypothetical protein